MDLVAKILRSLFTFFNVLLLFYQANMETYLHRYKILKIYALRNKDKFSTKAYLISPPLYRPRESFAGVQGMYFVYHGAE